MHVYLFNGNKYNKTPEEISIDFNFWNEKLIAYIYIFEYYKIKIPSWIE